MRAIKLIACYFANYQGIQSEKKGEYQKAIRYYTKAIESMPKFSIPYSNRGNMYRRINEYDKAIKDYQEAIHLNPQHSEAYNGLGTIYNTVKQYELAENCFKMAVDTRPDNDEALSNLGAINTIKGNYDKAIEYYGKAILACNSNKLYSYYYNRGTAYGQKGEILKAISDLSKSIELNPGFAEAYHNRALAYKNSGDQTKANIDYERAEELTKAAKAKGNFEDLYKKKWQTYKNRSHDQNS